MASLRNSVAERRLRSRSEVPAYYTIGAIRIAAAAQNHLESPAARYNCHLPGVFIWLYQDHGGVRLEITMRNRKFRREGQRMDLWSNGLPQVDEDEGSRPRGWVNRGRMEREVPGRTAASLRSSTAMQRLLNRLPAWEPGKSKRNRAKQGRTGSSEVRKFRRSAEALRVRHTPISFPPNETRRQGCARKRADKSAGRGIQTTASWTRRCF